MFFCAIRIAWSWRHYGKGKVQPRTGHEGPEMEYMYNPTLSLTSAVDGGG